MMAKLEIGQVVWTKHPRYNLQWPSKVVMKGQKDCWKVMFFSQTSEREMATVSLGACKPFEKCDIESRECLLPLYEAYKIAVKEHCARKNCKDFQEEVTEESLPWGVTEMREFLNEIVCWSAKGQKQAAMRRHLSFEVRQQDKQVYLRERFCQKLDFLINERNINRELVKHLMKIREGMKTLLMELFVKGELL